MDEGSHKSTPQAPGKTGPLRTGGRHAPEVAAEALLRAAGAAARPRPGVPFRERLTCTIAEAVSATGIPRSTIYRCLADGRLLAVKVDRRRLIRVPALLRLVGETVHGEDA